MTKTPNTNGPTDDDFDDWNTTKKCIHGDAKMPVFKDAEIWWVAFGVNVGVETYGKGPYRTRPAIVLRKVSRHGGLVVPITTQEHTQAMYHPLDWGQGPRWAMMHETRSASVYRFRSRIATLSDAEFQELRAAYVAWVAP